jgi:20S proteasome alpha/beta subunit
VTVIAYSSKFRLLAADSRCTDAYGMHVTSCQKIFRLNNGALLGTAGDSDDRDVRELLAKASPRKLPTRHTLAEIKNTFRGLLVFPKGQVYTVDIYHREFDHDGEWAASVDAIRDGIVAVGCGAPFAYGAMECGANPIQAVKAACRRDTACALPVQWEALSKKRTP